MDSNVTVAGQAAYELVLAPKDARSLVGQVRIAVDGSNGVPLRVQVLARGATTPAFQVGYTAIQFVTPAPADLSFTPPPGAKVTQSDMTGARKQRQGASPDASSIGSGWLTVLDLPSSSLMPVPKAAGSGGPVSVSGGNGGSGEGSALIGTLLGSATRVSGSWGSGRLLRTSLVTVLMTDNGRLFVGAVQPSVLYAAAGSAK